MRENDTLNSKPHILLSEPHLSVYTATHCKLLCTFLHNKLLLEFETFVRDDMTHGDTCLVCKVLCVFRLLNTSPILCICRADEHSGQREEDGTLPRPL